MLRKLALPLFFVLVTGAILYSGWELLLLDRQLRVLHEAPQGQAVGPVDADIVIVEFMDYRCKPCRSLNSVIDQVVNNHPEVRFIFRQHPVYKEQAVKEARIALAAGLQGKFMAMHDLLMSHEEPIEDKDIDGLCEKTGVECAQLKSDMQNEGITQTLLNTVAATRVLHIRSVPTFMIGNDIYTTNYGMPTADDFDRLIAQAKRNGKAPANAEAAPPSTHSKG